MVSLMFLMVSFIIHGFLDIPDAFQGGPEGFLSVPDGFLEVPDKEN